MLQNNTWVKVKMDYTSVESGFLKKGTLLFVDDLFVSVGPYITVKDPRGVFRWIKINRRYLEEIDNAT